MALTYSGTQYLFLSATGLKTSALHLLNKLPWFSFIELDGGSKSTVATVILNQLENCILQIFLSTFEKNVKNWYTKTKLNPFLNESRELFYITKQIIYAFNLKILSPPKIVNIVLLPK